MDAVVQLLRNGFCCIKDLDLFQSTFLWDANVTAQYYDFPEPLNKTTPLEAIISVLQLYVVLTGSIAGWNMFFKSFGKIRRIERLMDTRQAVRTPADSIVNASLIKEGMLALRSIFVGQNIFFISVSFFWLFANSWHVTETNWVGGLAGLIHALTVMEICLLPLLYYMWKDGKEHLEKSNKMKELAATLEKGELSAKDLPLGSFQLVAPDWKPFWVDGVNPLDSIDSSKEAKQMEEEISNVSRILQTFAPDAKKTDNDANEKEAKARANKLNETASDLLSKVLVTRCEGYREIVYLVINTIAFYGYAMSIVCYYFPDEGKQPALVQRLLFGMNNIDADWHGNFAGDLMWTIEPIIILTSPFLLQSLQREKKKAKAD